MEPEVLDVLAALDAVQHRTGLTGGVAEIGVHHGRLFIGMHLLRRPGERSVAVDVFGDQHLNVDASGRGDLDLFRANLARWADEDRLVVHQGDSTELTAEQLLGAAGGPLRLLSVDGGHTAETVLSDLRLAEAVLVEGGVVIADDVFNESWPGVATGTLRYLDGGGALVPFAIGFNKVLLARPDHCAAYRAALVDGAARRFRLTSAESSFADHEVTLLRREAPREVLRRSPVLRAAYRGARRAVRGTARTLGR